MESGLKIGFWNINGLSEEKMSDEAFKGEINKYDRLRRENINNLNHPNRYLCNFVFRNKRTKKAAHHGRGRGGFKFTSATNSAK